MNEIIARFDDPAFRMLLTSELAGEAVCDGLAAVVRETTLHFFTLNAIAHGDYRFCIGSDHWILARWLVDRCEKWLRDCDIREWLLDMKTGQIHTDDGTTWPNVYAFAEHHGFSNRNLPSRYEERIPHDPA